MTALTTRFVQEGSLLDKPPSKFRVGDVVEVVRLLDRDPMYTRFVLGKIVVIESYVCYPEGPFDGGHWYRMTDGSYFHEEELEIVE